MDCAPLSQLLRMCTYAHTIVQLQ